MYLYIIVHIIDLEHTFYKLRSSIGVLGNISLKEIVWENMFSVDLVQRIMFL